MGLQENKDNALAFYSLAFNDAKPRQAVERYVGDEYIQHNPHVENGKEAFIRYFEALGRDYPDKHIEFKRVIAEGDLVAVHTYQKWPNDEDYASIDIFRFDPDGKIVEHWDVLQTVPDTFAHDNGMF